MSDSQLDNNEVKFALAEYEACNDTRNHYDNIRWTIGSIFMAVSLGLFGLSFSNLFGLPFSNSSSDQSVVLVAVVLTFLFSLTLMLIWYQYSQHVNPYVLTAIIRAHEIESSFSEKGLRLNKKIWK